MRIMNDTWLPQWEKQGRDLAQAKGAEAAIRLGLKKQAERRKREEDKHPGLREALEELATDFPYPF